MSDYERIKVEDSTGHSPLPSKDNAEGDFFDWGAGAAGIPVLGQANNVTSSIWSMAAGDTDIVNGSLQVLASVGDLANFAGGTVTDPLGALFGALVDILDSISPTVDMTAADAAGVAEEVTATVQDQLTWGICGAIGLIGGYDSLINEINGLHKDASNSLTTLSENITGAAEDWRTADADSADLFTNVETDLQNDE